jgi:hypothetical protein
MSEFEFIAVLLSIVFGLAIANLLSGLLQAFLRRELTDTKLAWSILVGNILLVNWWVFFQWSDHTVWRFHEFMYLAIWATVHYLMAVSLFPNKFVADYSEERQRKFILITLLVAITLDFGEKLVRGEAIDPWYMPIFHSIFIALVLLPLVVRKPWAMRFSGWASAVMVLIWSIVVRGVLTI